MNRLNVASPSQAHSDTTSATVDGNVVAGGRALRPLVLLHRGGLVLDADPHAHGCDGEEDEARVAGTVFSGALVKFRGNHLGNPGERAYVKGRMALLWVVVRREFMFTEFVSIWLGWLVCGSEDGGGCQAQE